MNYSEVNVLDDMSVREGIKAYSNWPTIPQLYVKGEFVGGCDIVREMFQDGELQDLFGKKGIEHNAQTQTADGLAKENQGINQNSYKAPLLAGPFACRVESQFVGFSVVFSTAR